MTRRLRGAALACAVAVGLAAPAAAETVTLSLDAARETARAALAARSPAAARMLALGLLAANPADADAQAILAVAAIQSGDPAAGAEAARAVWRHATSPALRFEGAMLAAEGLARAGRPHAAQLWLRRAIDAAPDPVARRTAIAGHRAIAAASPLSARLIFSIAPSSNVNNGSRHEIVTIGTLPFAVAPAARAIPGGSVTAGAQVGLRLAQAARSRTDLVATAVTRQVWFNAAVPGMAPGDLGQIALEMGVFHRRGLKGGAGLVTLGAEGGRVWQGGRVLADTLRLEAAVDRRLSPGTVAGLTAAGEVHWRQDDPRRSALIGTLSARALREGAAWGDARLVAELRQTWSEAPDVHNTAVGLRLHWTPPRPVEAARIDFGIGAEGRHYAPTALAPGGRQDLRLDARAAIHLLAAARFGFAPTIDLRWSRTVSTVRIFETTDFGIGIGFRSVF